MTSSLYLLKSVTCAYSNMPIRMTFDLSLIEAVHMTLTSQKLSHISYLGSSLLTVSEATYEVEPWFHSWYRGRVETLDAKYNLIFR